MHSLLSEIVIINFLPSKIKLNNYFILYIFQLLKTFIIGFLLNPSHNHSFQNPIENKYQRINNSAYKNDKMLYRFINVTIKEPTIIAVKPVQILISDSKIFNI